MTDLSRTSAVLQLGVAMSVALALTVVGLLCKVRAHAPQRTPSVSVPSRGAPVPRRPTRSEVGSAQLDAAARALVRRSVRDGQLHILVERSSCGDPARYRDAELHHRDLDPGPAARPVLSIEVDTVAADLVRRPSVRALDIDGYPVLRVRAAAVASALAATAVQIRAVSRARPHLHFGLVPGNRFTELPRFLLLECLARRTRLLIHATDSDADRRPVVHLDG